MLAQHPCVKMGTRKKCRIWWPKTVSSARPASSNLLFGWFVSCSSASIDVVVAFARNQASVSSLQPGLQEILQSINRALQFSLRENSEFSLLGECFAGLSSDDVVKFGTKNENIRNSHREVFESSSNGLGGFGECHGKWSCGCHKRDGFLEQFGQGSVKRYNWIQLVYDSNVQWGKRTHLVPKLHHIHWNGQIVSQNDVHVIVYETPAYGLHHFSLGHQTCLNHAQTSQKKPKWFDELQQKRPINDLDTVIFAINSAMLAKLVFERHEAAGRSHVKTSITTVLLFRCFSLIWSVLSILVASFSTLLYVLLQILHSLLNLGSKMWTYTALEKAFSNSQIHIQIRSSQILHWPHFLNDNEHRFQSCVEHAEKACLYRHSMWSNLVVDILLGNLSGFLLFYCAEAICLWVFNFTSGFTNELLRSGCVWLMGVPAGFKLNTELAEVLGMVSLNAIHIWSTIWIFLGSFLIYYIKGLAILGILFGFTTSAALVIDTILISTLHVSTLHWLISIIYSKQLLALAALWRLFRGRKWNPLRGRLDSYDYTVKQHVVGSLLFALLLLLLPTTSAFYIFFSIMNTAICLTCISIGAIVSLIHATPYIKIALWLVSPGRFPSGIWFEIINCKEYSIDCLEVSSVDDRGPHFKDSQQKGDMRGKSSTQLISVLHSNFLSIGQLVLPHYTEVFSGFSASYLASSAYGVLTGKRIPSTLRPNLPSILPWTFIPWKEYWCLCRDSVLVCVPDLGCPVS